MLHPSERVFTPLDIEARQQAGYEQLQANIEQSRVTPRRQIALAMGLVRLMLLIAAAGLIRLFNRTQPDAIDRALGEVYANVPSMALHKKIELNVLKRQGISGATLDVGCGNGIIGAMLKDLTRITSMHGLDMLPAFAEQVKAKGYVGFTATDAAVIELPDRSFDSVVSVCVVEHIKDLDGALGGISRLLKSGGTFHFTTPAPEFRSAILMHRFWRLLGRSARAEAASLDRDASSMQFHYYDADHWRSALSKFGFMDVQVVPFFSRRQLFMYELLNIEVEFPRFYVADKLAVYFAKHASVRAWAVWSTSVLTACLAAQPCPTGQHTHWAVKATRC